MADGRIIIDTKVDTSGVEKGVNDIGNVAKTGLKVFAGAITGVATAVGGLSTYALKVGSDFEEGMSKVKAISGATGDELIALTEKAKEMGAKTKFSASESADAFIYMAQAGWKTNDMLNGIEGVMNLAAASGEDLAMVSDIVTDALTAFGLKAQDAGHFADVLARASSDSNTNVSLMGYTFKYVAPIAGALKYSIEDAAVAIGLMANAGIKGEQAGTSLRATLTRLVKPPKDASKAMEALGISAQNADGSMKPLNQLLVEMRRSFSNLDDSQKASYAASIAGTEAMSGLLAIVNASDEDFNNLTKSINNANGSAEEMATVMQDNLKGKMEQLGGALETLGLTAYEKFEGPIKEAVESVTSTVEKLGDSLNNGELGKSVENLAESFGKLIIDLANFLSKSLPKLIDGFTWILNNAGNIAAGVTGIGTALLMFNIISTVQNLIGFLNGTAKAVGLVAKAQTALNAILGMSPIGWAIIAITAVVAALVVLWNTNEDFRNFIISAWEKIKEVASDVWGGICDFFTKTIPDAFNSVKEFFTETVPQFFSDMWNAICQFFIDGWNSIVSFFTESIPAWIDSVGEWFSQLPYKIGYWLGEQYLAFKAWWASVVAFFTETIPQTISDIGTWFSELPGRIGEWLTNTWNNIHQWGSDTYNTATEWVSKTVDDVVNWFSELPGRLWAWFSNTLDKVSQWGSDMWNRASTAAKETAQSIVDWFSNLPENMLDIGKNIVLGIWHGIVNAKDWLKSKITGFCDGVVSGFKDALGIHSPSRIMRDIVGTNLVKGIGVGVDLEMPNLNKEIDSNIDNLTAMLKGTVDYETARTTAGVMAQNNIMIGNQSSKNEINPKLNITAKVTVPLDGRNIAEYTTPMVVENISNEQESYSIAKGEYA